MDSKVRRMLTDLTGEIESLLGEDVRWDTGDCEMVANAISSLRTLESAATASHREIAESAYREHRAAVKARDEAASPFTTWVKQMRDRLAYEIGNNEALKTPGNVQVVSTWTATVVEPMLLLRAFAAGEIPDEYLDVISWDKRNLNAMARRFRDMRPVPGVEFRRDITVKTTRRKQDG